MSCLFMEVTGENNRYEPYPNRAWNQWTEGLDPAEHFVCVQSVYVDPAQSEYAVGARPRLTDDAGRRARRGKAGRD